MNTINNDRILSEKDLGLIEEYAMRNEVGYLNGFNIQKFFPSDSSSYTNFGGNYFNFNSPPNQSTNHGHYDNNSLLSLPAPKSKKKDKDKDYNYGKSFAIVALASAAMYLLGAIPRLWGLAKEYYYTKKIRQIASREYSNEQEKRIIESLKELIKADRSSDFLRTQNLKTVSAINIIGASSLYIAADSYKIAQKVYGFLGSITPTFVSNSAKQFVPESIKPSKETVEKAIKLLSNDNLVNAALVTTTASVGLVLLNGAYNLYRDFFHETDNPKMFLNQKAREIRSSINDLRYGPLGSIFRGFSFQTPNVV